MTVIGGPEVVATCEAGLGSLSEEQDESSSLEEDEEKEEDPPEKEKGF